MSKRGIISNRLYVSIEIPFDKAWDDLGSDEQKKIVSDNIYKIDTDDLITELEYRGYVVKQDED